MTDEPGRPPDEEVASALAWLRAIAGEEVQPDEPAALPEPSQEGWRPGPLSNRWLPVLGYALAWGAFAFSLFVYPGWRGYLELLEFILGWAGDAP